MNTPVSFEIAKLLKEKGFDIPCWSYYSSLNLYTFELGDWNNHTIGDTSMHKRNAGYYSAPTIVEVVMWLYEKHGIWISVDTDITGKFRQILRKHNSNDRVWEVKNTFSISEYYNSPTEAYEAAIEYTLKNLL